jgi:hypothetical protein
MSIREADTQAIEVVPADIEAGPALASLMQRHQRLTRDDRLARLRDQEGDRPIGRRVDLQSGDPRSSLDQDGWIDQASIPSSFAAVPPRIAMRSASLKPGIDMIWSTGTRFHGNG